MLQINAMLQRQGHKPLLLLLILLTLLIATACADNAVENEIVVTEIVQVAGEDVVVTRIVRQEVEVVITAAVEEDVAAPPPVTLDIRFREQVNNLDPQQIIAGNSVDLVQNLFTRLTRYDSQENQFVPELAASWQVSSDGTQWIFNLRDDIQWVRPSVDPPGELASIRPVIADDFVFAIQRACDSRTRTPDVFILYVIAGCEEAHRQSEPTPADLQAIGVTAIDDVTIEIRLTKPADYLLALTSMTLMTPMPRDHFTIFGDGWQAPENLITSGPFMLSPVSLSNAKIVLDSNPLWPIARSGNVEQINIFYLASDSDAYALWQDKQLDVSAVPAGERDSLARLFPERYKLFPTQDVFYLTFSYDSIPLREAAVRRALSAAIDRELLIDEVEGGLALPMIHFVPPGTFGAIAIDEIGVGYDPDYARLQMANSSYNSCRLMPTVQFMTTQSDRSLRQAELLRTMWSDILGCSEEQFEIEQVLFGQLLVNTTRDAPFGRPDIWDLAWSPYYNDANNWLGDILHCDLGENRPNRPCSEVDQLINEAVMLDDPEDRVAAYRRLEARLFARDGEQPIAPLYVRAEARAQQVWLLFEPTLFGGEQYDTYVIQMQEKLLERSLE